MIPRATLSVQLAGLSKLRIELRRPRGPVRRAQDSWVLMYRAFVLRRFDKYSRGGGNWKRLSAETRRRKGSSAILVDTRLMRLGLATGIGLRQYSEGPRFWMELGFIGRAKRSKNLTVADLASIHHLGLGRVPERRILASPDPETRRRMAGALMKAIREVLR